MKCDEARPSCHRCLSTGRICDGYGVWGGGGDRPSQRSLCHQKLSVPKQRQLSEGQLSIHKKSVTIAGAALKTIPLHVISADEHVCMEWFLHRTLRKLPGPFNPAFWNTLLPQASLSEPAVLHAVLTLGSVHKRQALEIRTASGSDDADMFTLQQYIRATSDLRRRSENKSAHSTRVALIACAIFVYLEYLRGCYQTALTHLRHGLVLLEETLAVKINGKAEAGSGEVVADWMIQTFTSLFVQAKLFGQAICQPRLLSLSSCHIKPVDDTFHSVNHARQDLEHIMLRIFGQMSPVHRQQCFSSVPGNQSLPSMPQLDHTCASLQAELDIWLQSFERVMRSADQVTSPALERFAWRLLRVYHTLACVMLDRCLPSDSATTATTPEADTSPLSYTSADFGTFNSIFSYSTTPARFCMYPQHICSPQSHSISATATDTDGLVPSYHSILAQCQFLFKLAFGPALQSTKPHRLLADQDKSDAIADIGWIAPLYYTAIYGGQSCLRREAIRLLRAVPHREGIWDSLLAAAVAEKILDIEQANQISCLCEMHDRYGSPEEPRERRRDGITLDQVAEHHTSIERDIRVELPEGPHGKLMLSYRIYRHTTDKVWINGQNVYDTTSELWDR